MKPAAYLLALALVLTPGCSMFATSKQAVVISASDPSAEIFVNGQMVGTGTATVDLERNRSHAVLAKVGDRAGAAQIGTKISTLGALDIIGGFLFLLPFLGIAGPGFRDLDTTMVTIAIPPGE